MVYFIVMASTEGDPIGDVEFAPTPTEAGDIAARLAHSATCPVGGLVVVGESPATTERELAELPDDQIIFKGSLERARETAITSSGAGWIYAGMLRFTAAGGTFEAPAPQPLGPAEQRESTGGTDSRSL